MTSGFIYAKLPDDTTVFAKSANLLKISHNNNNHDHHPFFTAIDKIVNGDLHAEFIISSSLAPKMSKRSPVISINSYQNPSGNSGQVPIAVVVGLISTASWNVSEQSLKKEAAALNQYAFACVSAASKPSCESFWSMLLNNNNTNNNHANSSSPNRGKNLFSASSTSLCGFPRSIIDRAVPLAFCFVPPPVLGGEDLSLFNRRLNPLASAQDRTSQIKSHMPWPHDNRLTEHITDTLRIFSSFVADATISEMKDLMESRFACELLAPHAALGNAKDPKHRAAVESSMISPSESAQGSFFGRGTWFTGIFAAGDGAVVSATPGFFRLKLDDQILVANLVANSTSSGMEQGDNNNNSCQQPKAVRYAGNVVAGNDANNNNSKTQQQRVNELRPAIQATTLPPHLQFTETQVQFYIATSGSPSPIPGSIAVFTIDENLRFVVGMSRHQQQLAQRTTSEIFLWVNQLLENSMQTVSAREVANFCSKQRDPGEGTFGLCLMSCFGGGGGGGSSHREGGDDVVVPYHGLRNISYLTPGLLRHYSSILESSVAGVMRQVVVGGKYFGVPTSDLVRLNEAASLYEYETVASASPKIQQRYYLEMNFLSLNSINNGFVGRRILTAGSNNNNNDSNDTSSSLLNAQSWSEMLKFSDLIMLDPNNSSTGLVFGYSTSLKKHNNNNNINATTSSNKENKENINNNTKQQQSKSKSSNFSVASFSAPIQQKCIANMTPDQFANQTNQANDAIKSVHWHLQSILYSAVASGTSALPPTQ